HLLRLQHLLLEQPLLRDVDCGTDVAIEPSLDGSWYAFVQDPPVRPIAMSKAVLHGERLSRVECAHVGIDVAFSILWVHTLEPAITEFLPERSSGKGKPRFVEPVAPLVWAGAPDHHWRGSHIGESL